MGWQLTRLSRFQSSHHTLKLERVYFRINKRNLLLGAILWGLLSLVFTQEGENSIKEGFNELLGSGRERAIKGSQRGAGKLSVLMGSSP